MCSVVPLVGTWIEMSVSSLISMPCVSCPSWARGLKLHDLVCRAWHIVVPLVGTWIEINTRRVRSKPEVVPLVGTWIEIVYDCNAGCTIIVVPLVGTWIEMSA